MVSSSPPRNIMNLATAKQVDIMTLLGNWPLRRAGSTGGGELFGPCPFCGGFDRFRVQPNHPDGGRWYCRGCGGNKWHDTIDFVMRKSGVSMSIAVRMLDPTQPEHVQLKIPKQVIRTSTHIDRTAWSNSAWNFVRDCISFLWMPESKNARDYLHGRGLTDHTLSHWLIGYNPFNGTDSSRNWGLEPGSTVHLPAGIVIPCFTDNILTYVKIRRDDGEPKYQMLKGSQYWLYGADTYRDNLMGYIFESELDVLLAWQTEFKLGYASIPAGQKLLPAYAPYFTELEDLIVAFDNDAAGNAAADKLCKISQRFHKAGPLPRGKDLTEYYQSTGNLDDVLAWLYEQLDCIKDDHGS